MKNKITVRLSELIDAGILSSDKAQEIQLFYKKDLDQSQNRLFVIFGVLGAILVGLGIILILAHNWDDLSRATKTVIAFIPLLLGQGFCAFSLFKKTDSRSWKEASAAFLFFTVGACMSLISQIYNIPGNISSFTLTWVLLCLPLVYIMRSSIVSLMYIIGITYYTCEVGYWNVANPLASYLFWLLFILILPHYYYLYKNRPNSNFMIFHNWFIPLSVTIILGTTADHSEEFMFIAYVSLLGLFYLIGYLPFFKNKRRVSNGYSIMGSLGTVGILLFLSFKWYWEEFEKNGLSFFSPELFISFLLSAGAGALLFWKIKNIRTNKVMPMEVIFILFIPVFFIGMGAPVLATVLINILVFTLGVLTIWQGANENHLGILNYGLLIITALVICRFFDTEISFVLRGILFLLIGFGFFFTNYWMLQRRKHLTVNGEI